MQYTTVHRDGKDGVSGKKKQKNERPVSHKPDREKTWGTLTMVIQQVKRQLPCGLHGRKTRTGNKAGYR